MKVYLVQAGTGEYDCKMSWTLGAFLDKEKAEARVKLAKARAEHIIALYKHHTGRDCGWIMEDDLEELEVVNEFDLNMLIDITSGISYGMREVEVLDAEDPMADYQVSTG